MFTLNNTTIAGLLAVGLATPVSAQLITTFKGPCDASAAVALDATHFIVGDDEHNTLHIYRQDQPAPVASLNLANFLGTPADEESDIEDAAAIGSRIYWITSHGRNSKGKARLARQRFFATDVVPGQPPTVKPVGRAYANLLRDMLAADTLKPYRLDAAARRPPEADGGLNIEGLAATADGKLLIGLRSPLALQRALIIPLDNPAEVITGNRARFGEPILLDLGQRGIRSIERIGTSYLIVAGPTGDSGSFALYRWSGQAADAPTQIADTDLKDLRPEALFAFLDSGRVQLLSDDGGVKIGGVECKMLPTARQTFRGLDVTPAVNGEKTTKSQGAGTEQMMDGEAEPASRNSTGGAAANR
jgi:hypothetical protein